MKSKALYVARLLAALTLPIWIGPVGVLVLLSLFVAEVHDFAKKRTAMKNILIRWSNLRGAAKFGVLVFAPLVVPALLLCSLGITLYVVAEMTWYLVTGKR